MADRRPGGRAALGCCLLLMLLVVLPLVALAVAAWLLLRSRDRLVDSFRERIAGRLPEGCLTSMPAAAYKAYHEFMAELEGTGGRERDSDR